MDPKQMIVREADICGGRPRVRDTRLTAEFLLGLKAAGWADRQILEDYPNLEGEQLRAVYAFARAIISSVRENH